MLDNETLFNNLCDLYNKQRAVYQKNSQDKEKWANLFLKKKDVFQNTEFIFYGIKRISKSDITTKYNFLNSIGELFFYGIRFKKISPQPQISYIEHIISNLMEISIILGGSLVLPNGSLLASDMQFDKSQVRSEKHNIQGYEIAPIIIAWIEMLLEIKEDWKENFDKKLLEDPIEDFTFIKLPKCILEHPAYIKFDLKRENILDDLVAQGRMESKRSLARSL